MLFLLVAYAVKLFAQAVPPAQVIPVAETGSEIVAAGGLANPGAEMDSVYRGYRESTINKNASTVNNMFATAWQAQKAVNTLGIHYLCGVPALAKMALSDFWNTAKGIASSLAQWFQDLISANDDSYYEPQTGDVVTCSNTGATYYINMSVTAVHTSTSYCTDSPYNPSPIGSCNGFFNPVGYVYNLVPSTLPGPCVRYTAAVSGPATGEEADWPPPGGFPPDYQGFSDGLNDAFNPASPNYQPYSSDEVDKVYDAAPPGSVTTVPDATGADDSAPPLPGINPGDAIAATEPGAVTYPDSEATTPDPAIDNELLRGIYNNTLATARNTASTVTAIQNLALTGEPTDIQPVVDAIVALPGQIVPPLVGPIEALPAQIANPIVDKLDEIKETIPPPIESLELTGDQPALGDDNVYDTTIEEPEEESLSETILEFINNGLPFVSTLKQNAITLSNPSPSYDFVLYDHQFSFDFSPYESHLRAFGYLLYGLTVFSAFMIIVRR